LSGNGVVEGGHASTAVDPMFALAEVKLHAGIISEEEHGPLLF
jgi:hypothetical protein